DGLIQRGQIFGQIVIVVAGLAEQRGGENDWKVELLVGGAEAYEEVEYLIDDPIRTRAVAVDLVDDNDGIEAICKGFLGDEARLRHRAVDRIDQQQYRIHHRQHALDFTAEIGVTGGVDDVDAVIIPVDGGVFREDGNAAFALLIVRVHDPFGAHIASVQGAGLFQQLVDQRGFAVVNVGDDGDIAQFFDHKENLLRSMGRDASGSGQRKKPRIIPQGIGQKTYVIDATARPAWSPLSPFRTAVTASERLSLCFIILGAI